MKSVQRRFISITESNPDLSSYLCFAKTVKHRNFGYQSIQHWFYQLVEKGDYRRADSITLIEQLCELSKSAEETTF